MGGFETLKTDYSRYEVIQALRKGQARSATIRGKPRLVELELCIETSAPTETIACIDGRISPQTVAFSFLTMCPAFQSLYEALAATFIDPNLRVLKKNLLWLVLANQRQS